MQLNNKEILLLNDSSVMDIQDAFTNLYPFLKIDFFEIDRSAKTLKSVKIDPKTYLNQLANLKMQYTIDIHKNRTVSELSHALEHALGVIVQISRKSGNVWNMISVTDGWTLENQNTAGEFISSQMAITVIRPVY